MNKSVLLFGVAIMLTVVGIGVTCSAQSPGVLPTAPADLDKLAGQPVDIAPWAYAWRGDRAVQENPEAYFIPHRLQRLDKVYRTAFYEMPEQERKSLYYDMPELLKPLLPAPKGKLLAALLWTGLVKDYRVELCWLAGAEIPSPDVVEVRAFPSRFGWFGWTKDEVLEKRETSADRLAWTYQRSSASDIPQKDDMMAFVSGPATEMVAVFSQGARTSAVPTIRVVSRPMGVWKRMDVEIEWGFQPATEKADFDGRLEPSVAIVGPVAPLADDKGTKVTAGLAWQSRAAGAARRGIVVPMLYAPSARSGLDSRITIWAQGDGGTFRPCDLKNGPILIPEQGIFVTKVGSGKTARQFAAELEARHLKTTRQMVRDHHEAASWEELMRKVRLSTCPAGTAVPPMPNVPDPVVQVELPDPRWTGAWRAASFQLQGKHMWGELAYEVGRVAHEMDMIGLNAEADKIYQYFLSSPGVKSDGDYTDGKGALEWASSMRHDMGYSHNGTHASTGRVLFALADRYFLTGDKEWFLRNRSRLQAAADWIIRQRRLYLKDIPNRQDLVAAGLMPPCMLGDYALPSCDWHWYWADNVFSLQAVQRFADAVATIDPEAGRKYHAEADAFRNDIRRAVQRETAVSPVRLARDGMYHSFIPSVPYSRGALISFELGTPQRPQGDVLVGALPLAEPFGAIDANDRRLVSTLTVMDEIGTLPKVTAYVVRDQRGKPMNVMEDIVASVKSGQQPDEAAFWRCYGAGLPKASHNANAYLLQDDVPNFLRFWMNSYAAIVGTDGRFWEWGVLGQFSNCELPDNGTAGWFMENFRNLLMMEDGESLWVARATPRAWLKQGDKIAGRGAPTYFGALAYEIVSDVDHGRIMATVEIPSRRPPQSVLLRFRHPTAAPIKSVTVNGQPWTGVNVEKEIVELTGLSGKVAVVASY